MIYVYFPQNQCYFFRVDRTRQELQNDTISYSEKNEGGLQNPLSDKKGSALYPMAELLENGSAPGLPSVKDSNGGTEILKWGTHGVQFHFKWGTSMR